MINMNKKDDRTVKLQADLTPETHAKLSAMKGTKRNWEKFFKDEVI